MRTATDSLIGVEVRFTARESVAAPRQRAAAPSGVPGLNVMIDTVPPAAASNSAEPGPSGSPSFDG